MKLKTVGWCHLMHLVPLRGSFWDGEAGKVQCLERERNWGWFNRSNCKWRLLMWEAIISINLPLKVVHLKRNMPAKIRFIIFFPEISYEYKKLNLTLFCLDSLLYCAFKHEVLYTFCMNTPPCPFIPILYKTAFHNLELPPHMLRSQFLTFQTSMPKSYINWLKILRVVAQRHLVNISDWVRLMWWDFRFWISEPKGYFARLGGYYQRCNFYCWEFWQAALIWMYLASKSIGCIWHPNHWAEHYGTCLYGG